MFTSTTSKPTVATFNGSKQTEKIRNTGKVFSNKSVTNQAQPQKFSMRKVPS